MPSTFSIDTEDDHIRVTSLADKNMQHAETVWTAVAEACEAHGCYRVLGISQSNQPLRLLDGFEHVPLFRHLGIDHRYRIAWIEQNPDARETVEFIETAFFNRGINAKLFDDEAAARDWFFSGDE